MDATTNQALIDLLPWASGLLIMASTVPNIIRNLLSLGAAKPSPLRDLMQLTGNLGWALYGAIADIPAIMTMCGVSSVLLTILLVQQFLKKAPPHQRPISP